MSAGAASTRTTPSSPSATSSGGRAGPGIEASGYQRGEVGDVLLMGVDGIHSVQNPTRQWTAALHVYGNDFFAHPRRQWDPQTGQATPFDIRSAHAVLAAADAPARAEHIG